MLWWKLLLTPFLIGALTLIGRRWGPRVAGLIVGLPLTTGPVSIFLATEHGTAFATRAASGTVMGFINSSCFVAVFALIARRRRWTVALAGALAVLAVLTVLLSELALSLAVAVVVTATAILAMWTGLRRLSPSGPQQTDIARSTTPTPAWDLPARMLIATAMVAGVTTAAGVLGSRLSGVLSALPIVGGLLAIFAFHREGRAAAEALITAMVIGSIPALAFFAVVGTLLGRSTLLTTYTLAAVTAVVTGASISWLTRTRVDEMPAVEQPRGVLQRAA